MPSSVKHIGHQSAGQILDAISEAQKNSKLLVVSESGGVQIASKLQHFIVAVQSIFTKTDYKKQSHDAAKTAFIKQLRNDIVDEDVWTHLTRRVTALNWQPDQNIDFDPLTVLDDLQRESTALNLKNYERTVQSGHVLRENQDRVVTIKSGERYLVGNLTTNDTSEIIHAPGTGNAFKTKSAANLFYLYSSGDTLSPVRQLISKNNVDVQSQKGVLACFVHDHLLERELEFAEDDALSDFDVEPDVETTAETPVHINSSGYKFILSSIESALKTEGIDALQALLATEEEIPTVEELDLPNKRYLAAELQKQAIESEKSAQTVATRQVTNRELQYQVNVPTAGDQDNSELAGNEGATVTTFERTTEITPFSPSIPASEGQDKPVFAGSEGATTTTFGHTTRIEALAPSEKETVLEGFKPLYDGKASDPARYLKEWAVQPPLPEWVENANELDSLVTSVLSQKLSSAKEETEKTVAQRDAEFNAARDAEELALSKPGGPLGKPKQLTKATAAQTKSTVSSDVAVLSEKLKDIVPTSFKVRYASLQYKWEAKKQKQIAEKSTLSKSPIHTSAQSASSTDSFEHARTDIQTIEADDLIKLSVAKLEQNTFANSVIRDAYAAYCSINSARSPIIALLVEKGIDPRGPLAKVLTERYDQSLKTHLLTLQSEAISKGFFDLTDPQSIGTKRVIESFQSELNSMYSFYSKVVIDEQIRYLNKIEEENENPPITNL